MRLDDYSERENSKRVWLTHEELQRLIDTADTPTQKTAFMLGGQAGLRRSEIANIEVRDWSQASDGFIRVWGDYSKYEKYREAPIPDRLNHILEALTHDKDPEDDIVDKSGKTIYRWVKQTGETLHQDTGDVGWTYLDVHDLRRSWGGHLLWNCGVLPTVVMEFGGWEDWETFAEHYMGEITPEAQRREREKVFGDQEDNGESEVWEPRSQAAGELYGRS